MDRRTALGTGGAALIGGFVFFAAGGRSQGRPTVPLRLDESEWKKRLTPQQYAVLREAHTEPSGSSPLNREHRKGIFVCAGCGLPLYASSAKFESGTGWPSFWQPLPNAVATKVDNSLFMTRTEVHCRRCGGHLGHVFTDGPKPTGLRYCMNGTAMRFIPA